MPPFGIAIVFAVLAVCVFAMAFVGVPHWFQVRQGATGSYVAEVWLTWVFGRGSTLYRQRFPFRWMAYLVVRLRAMQLDAVLPRQYCDVDWSGKPMWYDHEYGIHYGVRNITAAEHEDFRPLWETELPGSRNFRGEHASAHPVFGDTIPPDFKV